MKHIALITLSIILNACSSSSDNTSTDNTSPLIGVWFTQACSQATDSNNIPLISWAKGKYEFTVDGLIQFDPVEYDDSQCLTESQQPITTNSLTSPSFIDSGEVTLQEGIQGHSFAIIFPILDNVFTIDSYYTINNGALCFSYELVFEPYTFGFIAPGSDAINFNDCLVKQ